MFLLTFKGFYLLVKIIFFDPIIDISFTVAAPPSGGIFTVTPARGYSLNTSFTFTASSWTDDGDFPLSYHKHVSYLFI